MFVGWPSFNFEGPATEGGGSKSLSRSAGDRNRSLASLTTFWKYVPSSHGDAKVGAIRAVQPQGTLVLVTKGRAGSSVTLSRCHTPAQLKSCGIGSFLSTRSFQRVSCPASRDATGRGRSDPACRARSARHRVSCIRAAPIPTRLTSGRHVTAQRRARGLHSRRSHWGLHPRKRYGRHPVTLVTP